MCGLAAFPMPAVSALPEGSGYSANETGSRGKPGS